MWRWQTQSCFRSTSAASIGRSTWFARHSLHSRTPAARRIRTRRILQYRVKARRTAMRSTPPVVGCVRPAWTRCAASVAAIGKGTCAAHIEECQCITVGCGIHSRCCCSLPCSSRPNSHRSCRSHSSPLLLPSCAIRSSITSHRRSSRGPTTSGRSRRSRAVGWLSAVEMR